MFVMVFHEYIGACWTARKGAHCCVASWCKLAEQNVYSLRLFGVFTLLSPRITLLAAQLEAQAGCPTRIQPCRRQFGLKSRQ